MGYDEIDDVCDIKYLDYGGYDIVSTDQLRQIRSDFQFLPFQVNINKLYFLGKNIFIPRNELCVRGAPTFRQGVLFSKLGKIYEVLGIQHVKEKLSFIFP